MPTLIAGAVAVFALYLLLQMFRAANPAVLARAIKIVGGVVALAVAAWTGLRGELAVAIPLGILAQACSAGRRSARRASPASAASLAAGSARRGRTRACDRNSSI